MGTIGVKLAMFFNHCAEDFVVKAGDHVAQLILERVKTPAIQNVKVLENSQRGAEGFGSTGVLSQSQSVQGFKVVKRIPKPSFYTFRPCYSWLAHPKGHNAQQYTLLQHCSNICVAAILPQYPYYSNARCIAAIAILQKYSGWSGIAAILPQYTWLQHCRSIVGTTLCL